MTKLSAIDIEVLDLYVEYQATQLDENDQQEIKMLYSPRYNPNLTKEDIDGFIPPNILEELTENINYYIDTYLHPLFEQLEEQQNVPANISNDEREKKLEKHRKKEIVRQNVDTGTSKARNYISYYGMTRMFTKDHPLPGANASSYLALYAKKGPQIFRQATIGSKLGTEAIKKIPILKASAFSAQAGSFFGQQLLRLPIYMTISKAWEKYNKNFRHCHDKCKHITDKTRLRKDRYLICKLSCDVEKLSHELSLTRQQTAILSKITDPKRKAAQQKELNEKIKNLGEQIKIKKQLIEKQQENLRAEQQYEQQQKQNQQKK